MTLSTLTVQCLIIGSTTLVLSAGFTATSVIDCVYLIRIYGEVPMRHIWRLVGFAAIAFVSLLNLVGIKKRIVFLLVPWLIAVFGITCWMTYSKGIFRHRHFDGPFLILTCVTGLLSLITYSWFKLIEEIQCEKAIKKQNQEKATFVRC